MGENKRAKLGWVDGDQPDRDEGVQYKGVHLHHRHVKALVKWQPQEHPFENVLEQAGYFRNLGLHLEHDGMRTVAFMAAEGLLEPESDPVDVLYELLEELRMLRRQQKE